MQVPKGRVLWRVQGGALLTRGVALDPSEGLALRHPWIEQKKGRPVAPLFVSAGAGLQ